MDLKLNPTTWDMEFVNGECPVTLSDYDVVSQRLKIRLQTYQGEYNFNTQYGVPYLQKILGRKASKQQVDNIFQEQILAEDGVVEILDFNSTKTNIYSLSFRAKNSKQQITERIQIETNI